MATTSAAQPGISAAGTARVSAAISYLRLLVSLVTRAPNPDEARVRARLLLVALATAVGAETCVLEGRGAGAAEAAARTTTAAERGSVRFSEGCAVGDGDGVGVGVRVRSTASDSAVLCMQTLSFLLEWAEHPVSGGGGGAGSTSSGSANQPARSSATPVSASSSSASSGRGGGASSAMAKRDSAVELALAAAARATGEDGGGSDESVGHGAAPVCLHGLRMRLSNAREDGDGGEREGGGQRGAVISIACYVCPLTDTTQQCEDVHVPVEPVRDEAMLYEDDVFFVFFAGDVCGRACSPTGGTMLSPASWCVIGCGRPG